MAEEAKESKNESATSGISKLIGVSPAIVAIRNVITKLSKNESTVLITGETGSGKGLVARLIHDNNQWKHGQFVAFSCGMIPYTLFESELFGHKKGAFTDAHDARSGLFQEADGGTLFLDDVQNAPLSIQAKLLQAIEDKSIRRLGESTLKKINVRIICATNENLKMMITQGLFREDLFYRISVITIHIPSLRERATDIPVLADHFLKEYAIKAGRKTLGFDNDAKKKMRSYSWPGNVREMQNVIERAVALTSSQRISADDIQLDGTGIIRKSPYDRESISCIVNAVKGNVSSAAKFLGITRPTLYKYLKMYKIKFTK